MIDTDQIQKDRDQAIAAATAATVAMDQLARSAGNLINTSKPMGISRTKCLVDKKALLELAGCVDACANLMQGTVQQPQPKPVTES